MVKTPIFLKFVVDVQFIIGTIITVSSIIEYYQQGMSFDEFLDEFDYIPSRIFTPLSHIITINVMKLSVR